MSTCDKEIMALINKEAIKEGGGGGLDQRFVSRFIVKTKVLVVIGRLLI
jgi:hypothetical protein